MHVHGARAAREGSGAQRARKGRGLRAIPATDAEVHGWDELVAATGRPHLLQSSAWAELKVATGWSARRFVLDDGGARRGVAQVLLRRLPLGLSVAYAPRGPLVDDELLPASIVALRDALGNQRCAGLLCDPEAADSPGLRAELTRAGVRRSPVFVQPRRTLLVDLATEPETLLAAMRKKTRQYIHRAERSAVVTEEVPDLPRFLAVLRTVGERGRFAIRSRDYFEQLMRALGDRAHVFFARVGGDDAGALLVARVGERSWELYGGWSGTHTEARPFYLLKWRAMLRMRALGVSRYDMNGLAEHLADAVGHGEDPLSGVENFKLGFGGEVATWIGALEVPVRMILYPIWDLVARRRLARSAA